MPGAPRTRFGLAVRDPWRWLPLVLVAVIAAVGTITAVVGPNEASLLLNLVILLVAGATWLAVTPEAGRLWVERQGELELSDFIFYVYSESPGGQELRIPRDFLFQLHVAACNVGGRKIVLSTARVEALLYEDGSEAKLPLVPIPFGGGIYVQRAVRLLSGSGQETLQSAVIPPPYILEPDDVITIRFRMRRGVDWSARWDLAELERFAALLRRPIVAARVSARYRRGRQVLSEIFHVSLKVEQQELYRSLLAGLTDDFTRRPEIPERSVLFD